MKQIIIISSIISVLLVGIWYLTSGHGFASFFFRPTESELEEVVVRPPDGIDGTEAESHIETIATGLSVPWELLFLPNGEMLVTQRLGNLAVISDDGKKRTIPVVGVYQVGEGGLLGAALHPRFSENHFLYLYFTSGSRTDIYNRVVRFRFDGDTLAEPLTIVDRIPGAANHNGGRIAFGPDGFLYVTTGDAGNSEHAQDTNSLAGKILRITDNGSIPQGNPFGNAVYSYGHRNPQGIAWDGAGRLWATEHGRSGIQSGFDELNLVERGKNYGWPVIEGGGARSGMVAPVTHSGPDETWAPASLAFVGMKLFFVGLRGQSLYEATEDFSGELGIRTHFRQEFGRLRILAPGPGGMLYIGTSNTDGRGQVRSGDDRLIRVPLSILGS